MVRRLMIPAGVALVGFVTLLGLVAVGWAPVERADTAASEAFRRYGDASPAAVRALRMVTDVMATASFLLIALTVAALLAARRAWRAAGCIATVGVLVPSLWGLIHWMVHRPRPVDGFVTVASNGFPSGHTANATAAALLAVLLPWPWLGPRGRIVVVAAAVSFAGFIGLTRVALLAHWPSDVLGGWLLGIVVVPVVLRLIRPCGGSAAISRRGRAR